ncbi:hypothetical protein B0A52_03044 [Exophiala mesophila]|uniref:Probable methionine--tRNA ligase, mitochondrial n=1 Tax=Exophiala mesophila TaxID=212818 RepID=A0A438NC97_EXOME|nr:hypothetical protein B0A52_03044 [Exophiala mesophila]
MVNLEHRARSFFLQCRASVQSSHLCRYPSTHAFTRRPLSVSAPLRECPSGQKPYYVTSPIFYVNAAPHAGHLYTLILTDVLKRWNKLLGNDKATLLTGTDEHGMKIQKAAQKANVDVQNLCDQNSQQFKSLCQVANIDYDRFIRTTDSDHKAAVDHFWRELNHAGYIYESKHEGWYSVSDETFYPESQIRHVLDPSTGKTKYVAAETGKDVEWTMETNYHFKLSHFQDRLLQHYRENPDAIVPQQRMNFIMKEIQSGLKDLSISRPSWRLNWGIRVPGDDSQTVYVWLDALLNYITMAGYPLKDTKSPDSIWPPDCQVIGKDIIRFHTIYWPAFLMALNLPLPKRFLTHAHWTMNSEKMSKSTGNVVNPFYAIERFGVDPIRFYMVHEGGIVDDASYDNQYIAENYNTILRNNMGNLLSRIFNSQRFGVREAVQLYANDTGFKSDMMVNEIPKEAEAEYASLLSGIIAHRKLLATTADQARAAMDIPNPRVAVQGIAQVISLTNKFFHNSTPWRHIQSKDAKLHRLAQMTVYLSAESVRIVSILLQPFMPGQMQKALDMMGVLESNRTFQYALVGADLDYGTDAFVPSPEKPRAPELFPKLISSF